MDPQDLWIQITGKLQVIKPRPLKSIIEVFVDQNDVFSGPCSECEHLGGTEQNDLVERYSRKLNAIFLVKYMYNF